MSIPRALDGFDQERMESIDLYGGQQLLPGGAATLARLAALAWMTARTQGIDPARAVADDDAMRRSR